MSAKTQVSRPGAGPPSGRPEFRGTRLGWIDHLEGEVPWVDFDGNPGASMPVQACSIGLEAVRLAESSRMRIVLVFEGDSTRPVLLGVVQPESASHPGDSPRPLTQVGSLSGQRVVLTSQDGLSLRCGGASITLDSVGGVRIQGERIETRATQVNQLRGDEIEIN